MQRQFLKEALESMIWMRMRTRLVPSEGLSMSQRSLVVHLLRNPACQHCRTIGNQAAFNDVLQGPKNSDLTVYKLPEALFPPGGTYFSQGFSNQRASVVHV